MQAKQELKDIQLNKLMEYKGYSVFMNEFRFMPILVTADESLKIFN